MKLWAIYIGGMVEGCTIEQHDFRFCLGETIEDCYPALKAAWWGIPESLHLDCWGALEWADGYNVSLKDEPADNALKLCFVHLGGYDPAKFTELHENFFIVAKGTQEARQAGIAKVSDWVSPHKDNLLEIDQIIDVSNLARAGGKHIHLEKADAEKPFEFEARYVPFGRMKA